MGFFDWLTGGGNIKIAANSLTQLHEWRGGNYVDVYTTRMTSLIAVILQFKKGDKDVLLLEMANRNEFKNYVDLVVLDLYVNAAPNFANFGDTFEDFSHEIFGYLTKNNLPAQAVGGDNRHFTVGIATGIISEIRNI